MNRHPDDGWIFADPRPMRASTREALRGLIRATCPPEPALHDLEDRLEVHVRRMLQYMTPVVAVGFVVAVHVVDWSPLWRFAAWHRIQHLPPETGAEVLARLSTSRWAVVRTMMLAIRGIVLSTFYDQDEIHHFMRWNPRPFLSDRIALRRRLLADAPPSRREPPWHDEAMP